MRKHILITVALTCSLFTGVAFAGQVSQEGAPSGCNVANVAGSYGYVGFGTVLAGNLLGFPSGSYSSVGTLAFDGKGNLVITDTQRIDDTFTPSDPSSAVTYAATYTVDSQCTLTFTLTSVAEAGIPGPHYKGVFVNNRRKIVAISLLPGVIVNYVSTTKMGPSN